MIVANNWKLVIRALLFNPMVLFEQNEYYNIRRNGCDCLISITVLIKQPYKNDIFLHNLWCSMASWIANGALIQEGLNAFFIEVILLSGQDN